MRSVSVSPLLSVTISIYVQELSLRLKDYVGVDRSFARSRGLWQARWLGRFGHWSHCDRDSKWYRLPATQSMPHQRAHIDDCCREAIAACGLARTGGAAVDSAALSRVVPAWNEYGLVLALPARRFDECLPVVLNRAACRCAATLDESAASSARGTRNQSGRLARAYFRDPDTPVAKTSISGTGGRVDWRKSAGRAFLGNAIERAVTLKG